MVLLKKVAKIILKILLTFIAIFLLVVLALQIPFVQNYVKDKAVVFLEETIKTKVEVGSIEIGLPKKVILRDFYFEDQHRDTLLAGKTLKVDISLLKLLSNTIEINAIHLERITANIKVNADSVYNFDYIIKAFETDEPKTNDNPMEIAIKNINLNRIKFTYQDAVSKNYIDLYINHLDTKISKFDLDNLSFGVPDINLEGLKLSYNQEPIEVSNKVSEIIDDDNETEIKLLKLNLKNINLDNINVKYKDVIAGIDTEIQFKNLNTEISKIDLEEQLIAVNTITLNQTKGDFTLLKSQKNKEETVENTSNSFWKINFNDISITHFNFGFSNNNAVKVSEGIDFNYLQLFDLSVKAESIVINDTTYSGNIESFQFKEQSGFELEALTTSFNYGAKSASLKDMYLKTPQTILQNSIQVSYPSIESLSENPENLVVNARLTDSKLGFKDVLLLVPQLRTNPVFRNNEAAVLNFNSILKGRLDNLNIDTFNVNGLGSTYLDINGSITGLPNMNESIFDIAVVNFKSSSKDIYAFTPKNTIPDNIQLPEIFNLKGHFKGGINDFKTNILLESPFGKAIVDASFNQSRKNEEQYLAEASLDNFDLGKLIKNTKVGKVTVNASLKGRSLDPAHMQAELNSKIATAKFNNYDYQNIVIGGKIDNGLYDANVKSDDPNINFNLNAKGSTNPEKPNLDLKLDLELIDLNKLNLHAGPLKMKGNITANFEDLNLENLNGTLSANNFLVALETEQFPIDTISIRAISSIEKDSIILKSQFVKGIISGNYNLSNIGDQITNSISKYYQLEKAYVKNDEKQNFDFEVTVKDNQITKKIIPELTELSEIILKGSYNTVNDSMALDVIIPRLSFANNEISGGIIKVSSEANALQYNLTLTKIKNSQFEIAKTTLFGKAEANTVDYSLLVKDALNKDKYSISGVFKDSLGSSHISFNPEKFLLNYNDWNIDKNNRIKIADKGIQISNFKIENKQQRFSLQSEGDEVDAPITAHFENFNLESLTSIAQSNFQIGGAINGEATIKNVNTSPLFVADLNIENFKIKNDTVGTINLKVDNGTANLYQADMTLSGLNNQLTINGNYNVSNENLNFVVAIQKLQMQSIQPFTLENLDDSEGFLNGKLTINGIASNPTINGNIKFNDVGFLVVPLNSKFNLLNDQITFNTNQIGFDDFKLQDENGNPLKINGVIDSKDYNNLGFNLNVIANNFKAVNSKANSNDLFYGELFLDNNLNIKGTLDNPVVDGTLKINADTKFAIVLPQSDPSIADREGVVEFIDQDQPILITADNPTTEITQTEVRGINASVNIVVDKKAEISIIIDEANGDFLKLQGEAELTGGIDASGKTTLTGKYEFSGGSYEMNFNLIKRKFDIKPGSYILWTGEPTTANVDITAIYNVEASPLDLVDDQLSGITDETRNTYKQRIPFETELKMKGELLQPQISFDIVLPEENNAVSTEIINTTQTKLEQIRRDEDALNKQVFALLLLNRFIGENPFQSETGGVSGAFLAKQSASKILSQQLNNLAGDLIKGFELNFDLEATEDYSSGQKEERTDLNVGLSKQLLNDRLKVTVGSNIGLEGTPQENQQASTIAGDVTADYLITEDGRYKFRAYRKNNYQVALQGQVIETGVAFIITMNYNKFKELFQKNRKDRKKDKKKNETK